MNEGNLKRYLIYGVGEILLVMIGILLALQVNNWNEKNNDSRVELSALLDLKEEFLNNAQSFEIHLESKRKAINQWKEIIKQISDKVQIDEYIILNRPSLGVHTFNPSQSTLNKLLNTGKIDKIENDSLKYLLSSWDNVLKEYIENEGFHFEFFQNHFIPYEMRIKPIIMHNYPNGSPFYSKEQQKDFNIQAFHDFKYQNLLIRNYNTLSLVISKGDILQEAMKDINRLLDAEIKSKK